MFSRNFSYILGCVWWIGISVLNHAQQWLALIGFSGLECFTVVKGGAAMQNRRWRNTGGIRRILGLAAVSICILMIGGCASDKWSRDIGQGQRISDEESRKTAQRADSKVISIRWPALIDQAAKPIIAENYRLYVDSTTGYNTPLGKLAGFANFLEANSTLYAAELYWAIRRIDPTVTVLLEPHLVRLGVSGGLVSIPLVDPLPQADLIAHLWSYSHPNPELPLIVAVLSFSLQSAPIRSPDNCGNLFLSVGTEPLVSLINSPACRLATADNKNISHWLLDGKARDASNYLFKQKSVLPLTKSETVFSPSYVEGFNGPFSATASDYVRNSRAIRLEDAEAMVLNPFVLNYAAIAVSGLGVLTTRSESVEMMLPYIQQFDAVLGDKVISKTVLSSGDKKNIALIQKLQDQEFKIRARRDEEIAREILAGDFGQSFRRARDDAYANYGKRMAAMWTTTAGSIALGGAMLQGSGSAAGVLAANNKAIDSFNQKMESDGLTYIRQIAPSLSKLDKSSLSLVDSSVKVVVSDQQGLRSALKDLYKKYRAKN